MGWWTRPRSWRKRACCGGGGEDCRESDKDNGAKGTVVYRHFQNIFRSDFIFCDKNFAGTREISIYFWREPPETFENLKLIKVIKIRNQNSPDRLIPEPNFETLPKNTDHNPKNPPTFQHFTFNDQDATCANSSAGFFKYKPLGSSCPIHRSRLTAPYCTIRQSSSQDPLHQPLTR